MFDTLSEYYQYRENLFQTFLCQSEECREIALQNIPPAPKLKRQKAAIALSLIVLGAPIISNCRNQEQLVDQP